MHVFMTTIFQAPLGSPDIPADGTFFLIKFMSKKWFSEKFYIT